MQYLIPPWKHQLEAIYRAKGLPWFALFFEMGAGKSMTAINILRHKINEAKYHFRIIIFCPPRVVPNWKNEWLMHSNIPETMITLLDGSGEKRLKLFNEMAYVKDPMTKEDVPRPHIFVTNYESLLLGGVKINKKGYSSGELFKAFQKWTPDALIFDESHRLKNYSALRSKQAEILANPKKIKIGDRWKVDPTSKPYCYILSGSPVLNSPMDLFFQFLVMDGGETFSDNPFVFRAKYFEDKNAGMPAQRHFPDWQIKPGAVENINYLISKYSMRVTKEECLDLPEEISVTIKISMTLPQAKNYKEMKQDLITFLESNVCSADLAIVKALRLMQIASGFLALNSQGKEEDVATVVYPKTPKEEACFELLEELTPHSKVIVWCVWKENYAVIRKICESLNVKYVEVHGGVSGPKQDANVAAFQTDESIRVLISHPGSGGIGINLTCAKYDIFYSRTFSLEHYLQARARTHRGGQKNKVTHYDLVCENTIDEIAKLKVAAKEDMSEKLLSNISVALRAQVN